MLESRASKYGQVQMNETEHFEKTAELASEMVVRWGMVAAVPDGEDSSGRQAARLLSPEELVERAFETAELFMARARKSHVHISPTFAECIVD